MFASGLCTPLSTPALVCSSVMGAGLRAEHPLQATSCSLTPGCPGKQEVTDGFVGPLAMNYAPGGKEGLNQTWGEKHFGGLDEKVGSEPCHSHRAVGVGTRHGEDARPQRAHLQLTPQLCSWGAAPRGPGFLSLELSALTVTPNRISSLLPACTLWVKVQPFGKTHLPPNA